MNEGAGAAPIRVLLVDDHAIVRQGICLLLLTEPGIEVAGEASSGAEAVRMVERLRPDVILMDLVMPTSDVDGIEATRQIVERDPDARILVLTSFATDDKVFPAIKAGARGYLLKDSRPEELLAALRQVYQGESSLHPSIARRVLAEIGRPAPAVKKTTEPLTDRELEVLKLVADGRSNQGIAARLVVSEATVRTHVSAILRKLQLASRTQAALYALRQGIAALDRGESD